MISTVLALVAVLASCPPEGWNNGGLGAPGLMVKRYAHVALWTGTHMLVIGGPAGMAGEVYDPVSDTARPMSTLGAPEYPMGGFTAIWTGREMIVWGTAGAPPHLVHTAGRYDPATDTWRRVSLAGAPPAVLAHTATWNGTRMVVAGGQGYVPFNGVQVLTSVVPSGGTYDPVTDTWGPGPAYPRGGHVAVRAGDKVILMGGTCSWSLLTPGHDPCAAADTPGIGIILEPGGGPPRPITSVDAPELPPAYTAVWSGAEVLIWGSRFAGRVGTNVMARYDPLLDLWSTMSAANAPSPRVNHSAVWTGAEMIVWGGSTPPRGGFTNTGGRYNLASDSWEATSMTAVPSPRDTHSAIWNGSEMIVWGGFADMIGSFDDGGRYAPPDPDADGDGASACDADCDDQDDRVYPGAPQVCGDGVNNDCLDPAWPDLTGTNEADDDGDGSSECSEDCDDAAPQVHPGAADLPGNTADENCDGRAACDPAASWRSHGHFMACVARTCNRLVAGGLVTPQECAAIARRAARMQGRP